MANTTLITVLYLAFALLFSNFSLQWLRVKESSEMFTSIDWKFSKIPWATAPEKFIEDISDPSDLKKWMQTVFIPGLFLEVPKNGDADRFCTQAYPCNLGEGDADEGYHDKDLLIENHLACEFGLKLGDNNCPLWMGPDNDCCMPYEDGDQHKCVARCTSPYQDDCQESQICKAECKRKCDQFIVMDVARACARSQGSPSGLPADEEKQWADQYVCPENIGANNPMRAPVVSSFNVPLFVRISMKKYMPIQETSHRFLNSVRTKRPDSALNAYSFSSLEDTKAWSAGAAGKFLWEKPQYTDPGDVESFRLAGGYVAYIDISKSRADVDVQFAKLQNAGWFENQGTFTIEMLFYNGNINKFMQIAYTFEHKPTGSTSFASNAVTFDLSLYDTVYSPNNIYRILMEVATVILYVKLCKQEFEEISDDFAEYISKSTRIVDIISLSMSGFTIMSMVLLWRSREYLTFQFPIPEFASADGSEATSIDYRQAFEDLSYLASLSDNVGKILAFNICIVMIRFVTLLSQISFSLGVVVNTLAVGMAWFTYFGFVFVAIFSGFVLASYFVFGHAAVGMSSLPLSFLTCFKMIFGISVRGDMEGADEQLGSIIYHSFVVTFTFVLLNVFLAIIIYAYNKEKTRMESNPDADPIQRLIGVVFELVMKQFVFLRKFKILRALGGGQTRHTNYDNLRKLEYKMMKSRTTLCSGECLVMIFFIVLYVALLSFLREGDITYSVQNSVQDTIRNTAWLEGNPARTMQYHDVRQLEDAEGFASNVMVKAMYKCSLEKPGDGVNFNPDCRNSFSARRPDFKLYTGVCNPMDAIDGVDRSVCDSGDRAPDGDFAGVNTPPLTGILNGYAPNPDLPRDTENMYQPRLSYWNLGVDPWNFVRITVQANCFILNPNERWRAGYRYILYRLNTTYDCATNADGCMSQIRNATSQANVECLDYDGHNVGHKDASGKITLNAGHAILIRQKFNYTFNEEAVDSSFNGYGGYVVGMGNTLKEADDVIRSLYEDRTFTAQSASIVFDFASYNGNVDIMTHTSVQFSLNPSGEVSRKINSVSFPVHIYGGGGEGDTEGVTGKFVYQFNPEGLAGQRSTNFVMLLMYLSFQFMILVNFFRELNLQYLISRERGSEVMFMRDFFVEDYWHFVDMGSMALAAVTLVLYIRFSYYRPLVPFDDRPPTFDSPRLTLEWLKSFFNAQAWAYYFGMDGLSQYSFTQYHVYNSKIGGENPESGLDGDFKWTNEDAFALLSEVSQMGELWDWVMFFSSVNSLLLALRVLKYLPSLQQLKVLLETIQKCVMQIMVFALIIVIPLSGFGIMFHVQYGIKLESFKTTNASFITLFRWLVGNFEIDTLYVQSPLFTTIMVPVFMSSFFFVMTKMFLAIFVRQWKNELQGIPVFHVDVPAGSKKTPEPQPGMADRGLRVMRGPTWSKVPHHLGGPRSQEEDGGPDGRGTVQRLKHSGGDGETSVVVLWDHGGISDYRIKVLDISGDAVSNKEMAVLMTVSEARRMSVAEFRAAIQHAFEAKLLSWFGSKAIGDSAKSDYLNGKDWEICSALQRVLKEDGAANRAIKNETKRKKARMKIVKRRCMNELHEKVRRSAAQETLIEEEDFGAGVFVDVKALEDAPAAEDIPQKGKCFGLLGKSKGRKKRGKDLEKTPSKTLSSIGCVGFIEATFSKDKVEHKQKELASGKFDTEELLLDCLYCVLDTMIVEGERADETNESFVQMIQRLCIGTVLPKALSEQQKKALEIEKDMLLNRLHQFYQVLKLNAKLKHLELEYTICIELHTVMLRQNMVLVKHAEDLEFDLARARQHISSKKQAASAFRRACEAIS
jgi:hypothetical protein